MRKAKTPFLRALQTAFGLAQKSRETGKPVGEIIETEKANAFKRRDFIKQSMLAAVALGTPSFLKEKKRDSGGLRTDIKIGIVGGGVAGLNAAYVFQQAGFYSQVFEATTRAGGRMFSNTNVLAPGLVTEYGGEFIDSAHTEIMNLASEFGFSLLDRVGTEESLNLIDEAYYFNGHSYSLADLAAQATPFLDQLNADVNSLPNVISYHNPDPVSVFFDNLSITAYLDLRGYTGWFKQFIISSYVAEYGLEANQQSSINYIFLVSTSLNAEGDFYVYGTSNERYKVKGGNQQIPLALASVVPSFNTGYELQSIKQTGNQIKLGFNIGPDRHFDYVIIAIPFTILRNIDIDIQLPKVKRKNINELGYGTNAKVMAGFTGRKWNELGYGGYSFTDLPFLEGWENSEVEPGPNGGYTFYLSGNEGLYANQAPLSQKTKQYLNQLDQIFPGVKAQYNGKSVLMHWPSYPYTKGSYACYKVGQWTTIAGAEPEPVGNLYFAGEHCSYNFQGYMEGAAETGRAAAEAILAIIV